MNDHLHDEFIKPFKGLFREVKRVDLFWGLIDLQPSGRWGAYCRNVNVGKTIYGRPSSCDYVFAGSNFHPSGLAVKFSYQEQSGSVNEKFPYWIENMRLFSVQSALILDGPALRQDAVKWAKKQVDKKLIMVCTIDEFHNYFKRRPQ